MICLSLWLNPNLNYIVQLSQDHLILLLHYRENAKLTAEKPFEIIKECVI